MAMAGNDVDGAELQCLEDVVPALKAMAQMIKHIELGRGDKQVHQLVAELQDVTEVGAGWRRS